MSTTKMSSKTASVGEQQQVKKEPAKEPLKEVLEDDDFEEFAAEDWQTQEESFPVWEDNWDDDDVEEDFHQQLMQQKR